MAEQVLNFEERLRQRIGRAARDRSIAIRFTEAEAGMLESAAQKKGEALREWAREALLQAARRPEDDMLFTELIATRMLLLNVLRGLAMGEKFTPEQFGKLTEKVRSEKRKVAREVMEQYSANQPKE
jgi:hypothetical protein